MNVIKTNYNNAFVKKPITPTPTFNFFRNFTPNEDESVTKTLFIYIKDNLDQEPFFTNYKIFVYVEDELVGTCTKRSNDVIKIIDADILSKNRIKVLITGYYFNDNGYQKEFASFETTLLTGVYCSTHTFCSESLYVSKIYSGYFNQEDRMLYEDEEFTSPVELVNNRIYIDLLTDHLYKWNNEQECYILI